MISANEWKEAANSYSYDRIDRICIENTDMEYNPSHFDGKQVMQFAY